ERNQRRIETAEMLECRHQERIHHQPRLHVGDAWTVGSVADDRERAAPRLALSEDGVAMTHQQHWGAVDRFAPGERRLEDVAAHLARDHGRVDATLGEEEAEALANSIHPRL